MSTDLHIPSLVYGPAAQVRERVLKAIRDFIGGMAWNDALEARVTLAASEIGGLIVLNGPSPLLRVERQFHIYMPHSLLQKSLAKQEISEWRKEQVVTESLATPWGLIGLIAPPNQALVYPAHLHAPIVRAAIQWWDCLDAVGARYSVGLPHGARLWDVTTNLHYVLGRLGATNEQLRRPLPPGGIAALVPAGLL